MIRIRRAAGTGSIFQRKDGRWVSHVEGLKDAYFRDEAEARAGHDKRLQGALPAVSSPTLVEWAERWLAMREAKLRPSTIHSYRKWLAIPLSQKLGRCTVAQVTKLEIAETFALLEKTRGGRNLASAFVVLRKMLGDAAGLGLRGDNPMEGRGIEKPTWKRGEDRPYWSVLETKRFIAACEKSWSRVSPLLILLCTCGLRYGEAAGLDWKHVHIEKRLIHVVQTATFLYGPGWVYGEPKTARGKRWVGLPLVSERALKRSYPREEGLVFHTKEGTPIRREAAAQVLVRMCKTAEVPYLNLHGLRHVCAMLELEAKGDAHAVMNLLGHGRVGFTMQHYIHPRPSTSTTTMRDVMDNLLGDA